MKQEAYGSYFDPQPPWLLLHPRSDSFLSFLKRFPNLYPILSISHLYGTFSLGSCSTVNEYAKGEPSTLVAQRLKR